LPSDYGIKHILIDMKIAILVSMFPPAHIGGAEIAAQNTAKCLTQKGHDVSVITSCGKDLPRRYTEDGFLVNRIYYPEIKYFGVMIFWIRCLFLIKKINPDIVHSQGVQIGLPSFLAKKIFGIPYVAYCRGSDVYLPWKFKKTVSRLVLNSADAVIALTDDMKNEVQKNCKKNIIVIPNGISLGKYKELPKQVIRDKFKIHPDEKIIVFVGSLRPVKGLKYLIEAFKIINKKNPMARLFLVGDGPERHSLEDIAEKDGLKAKVNFIGQIENDEIPKYMAAADIFVLPSLSEGFPGVVLEAMASGLPIVATKVRGLPEIVKDGENGFLVEPENPGQIAEKALALLGGDKLREKISNNNKEKAKGYSWEKVIDKIEKAYSAAIAKNHGK